jgi:predicted transcriptional regulator
MDIQRLLEQVFNEKQAKVYLACLELGNAKIPSIAKKAELKRTTVYGLVDELVALGMLSYSTKGKTKLIRAQEPKALLEMLDNKKQALEKALPGLQELFGTAHIRPQLQFFEGREGVRRVYEDTLTCKEKKIYQIVKVQDFMAFPGGDFSRDYIRRRAAKGIEAFALHPKSGDVYDTTYGQESKEFLRHVRYLPPDVFHASMIMIYDDKVAMISTRQENFGCILQSKEFSATLRALFDFMWNLGSKEPEKA